MGVPVWIKSFPFTPLFLGLVFFTTSVVVCLLLLIGSIFIWPFSKSLYRKIAVYLSYISWSQFSFLANYWCEVECVLYVDPEDQKFFGKEHSLVMSNHAYEIDWLMAWMMAERHGMLSNTKVYGKEILRYVPILGWSWSLTESIFLKRNWEQDKQILEKSIGEILTYPDNFWVTLLLYPEGTRWTPEKHAVCLKIAKEKGYPEYRHVLLPRTRGFYLSTKLMKDKIPSILDLTVAFPEPEPTFLDAMRGKKIRGSIKVKRYLINDVPTESEEACGNWLRQLYKQKDDDLQEFKRTGKFHDMPIMDIPQRKYDLYCFIFSSIFTAILIGQYAAYVIFYASALHQTVVVVVLVLMFLMMQWAIRFTMIKHGTSYGLETKQNGDEKKTN